MLDVLLHLATVQRSEVKAQPHTLYELLEIRRIELVLEFGLAGQDDPQHFFLVRFDSRDHPHLLEHFTRQVLRLIDNQNDFLAV